MKRNLQGRTRTPSAVHRAAGAQMEPLEARAYFSLVYEALSVLPEVGNPSVIAPGYHGPVEVLDDLDSDGVRDLLVGNAGLPFYQGAAVMSGATGVALRNYYPGNDSVRLGWHVAALGDFDNDAVGDYAIGGIDGSRSITVFSGLSGAVIRTHVGTSFALAGDLNADGVGDLVTGDPTTNAVRVFSGDDGSLVREFAGADYGSEALGAGVLGGADFNDDGVPDVVALTLSLVDPAAGTYRPTLRAISGADGALLWTNVRELEMEDGSGNIFVPIITPDLTGDGAPDVAFTNAGHIYVLDGAGGDVAMDFLAPDGGTLGRRLAVMHDVDGDSRSELVVGQPSTRAADGGVLRIFSTGRGSSIATLRTADEFLFSRSPFGDNVAAGDLDGDGLSEVFGSISTSTIAFQGDDLSAPTVLGITAGAESRSILWGMARGNAFVMRDTTVTFLSDLPEFAPGERIVDVFESGSRFIVLGSAADGLDPFIWSADPDLSGASVTRRSLATFTVLNAPPGSVSGMQGVALSDGVAVVVTRLGMAPMAWIADLEAETLTLAVAADPIDIARSGDVTTIIARPYDSGFAGLIWRNGESELLTSFPVALSPTGNFVVSVGINGILLTSTDGVVTLPSLEGGDDFVPTGVNSFGDVVGTYSTAFRKSGFIYSAATGEMRDLHTGPLFGAPDSFASDDIDGFGSITDAGDILVRRSEIYGLMTTTDTVGLPGPFRAAPWSTASVSVSPDGRVYIVTVNAAGEVVTFDRTDTGYLRRDLDADGTLTTQAGGPVTWYEEGDALPHIAASSSHGLLLLTPDGDTWTVRNLTQEIGGGAVGIYSIVTLVPPNGLRLLAGLSSQGLVIYGQTHGVNAEGQQEWAFQNLQATVVVGAPQPNWSGGHQQLIAYVTSWGAINIAGIVDQGGPLIFWSAPGLTGWQVTNLSHTQPQANGMRNLRVALTPWDGINLYGEARFGDAVHAVWWVPELGSNWGYDQLAPFTNTIPGPGVDTLTAWSTPWGGLNVARIDPAGKIEVFWWSPASGGWQRQFLNDHVPGLSASFRVADFLDSHVSPSGEFSVMARNELGDLFRFFWSPGETWALENL